MIVGLLEAGVLVVALLERAAVDPEPAHLVGTGGAVGALARHWIYERLSSERVPWPTLVVNVVGSFGIALAIFAGASESVLRLVGVGVCGSFTTFSTFSVETVRLYERGDRALALATAAGNLALSLAAVGLAWAVLAAG